MKKVDITNTGGHPLITENFSHLQNGVTEALFHLSLGLGYNSEPGMRLWGISFTVSTSTDITWTAGAIWLNGSICQVPAGSATKTGGQVFKWEVYQVALPIDPQTYADAGSHDVHLEDKARIVAAASLGGSDAAAACPFLIDVVAPQFAAETLVSGDFTAEDDLAAPVVFTTTVRTVSWRKVNKMMLIDINISGSVASASDNLFIKLPGSNVSAGNYHSVAFINDTAYILKAETGQNKLKIASGATDSFSGSFDVEGQIQLLVQ